MNELKVEWVGEKQWTYRLELPEIHSLPNGAVAVLAFDGLDTFATVKLNDAQILSSDNMFIAHRVDVTHVIKGGARNLLEIDFDSALLRAREIEKQHPEHKWLCMNGETARLGVRKNQCHWGWDWGPVLMTCGPWKAVRLEIYQGRVADLWSDVDVSQDLKNAKVDIHAKVEGSHPGHVTLNISLHGRTLAEESVEIDSNGIANATFNVDSPQLWYPHGYGRQPLYELSASLAAEEGEMHRLTRKTGLRRAELVQEKDKHGKSFYFRINNVPVFCGGSDWIPADTFTPRISDDRYRRWLELMVDGNQCMIRVWGGGIWEPDVFYDLCDELGIMVWQDFLFGCGNYPAFPEILRSIEVECESQLTRIRHHPSIVIYAGNNEDYQVQEQFGLTYDYEDKNTDNWLKTDFPARYIYEKLLPDAVQRFSPSVAYHPGSPWGDGKPTNDRTVGDLHQWNVWHGTQEKYQIFDHLGGRFNSEFGMEAFPHIQTIKEFVTDDDELYPQSHTLDFHNKADGHERRIATYMVENFRTRTDLEGFIHLTQLGQSEALMYAYRGWRQQWGDDRKCGGALCWQLNDCWPVTSWAICDYYLRKKPAYYAMARVLAPLAVGVRRAHHDWSVAHARPAPSSDWELYLVSNKLTEVEATVELRFISVKTGKEVKEAFIKKNVTIVANGTTNITSGTIDNIKEEPHVLSARLLVDGKVVARDMDWPQPLKYLSFEDRGIKVEFDGESKIHVTTEKPVKGLVFEEREGVLISDSAIDVAPGDEQIIKVRHFKKGDEPLSWRYLGSP